MAAKEKTPIHKHIHPAYGWLALIVCTVVILGVAGWYYLTISGGYDDDVLNTVKEMTVPARETSSTSTASRTDVKAETTSIDTEVNSTTADDFTDTQLDNTILGIQ